MAQRVHSTNAMRSIVVFCLLAAPAFADPGARKPPLPIKKTVRYQASTSGIGRIRHTKWTRHDGTRVHQVDAVYVNMVRPKGADHDVAVDGARIWTRSTEVRDDGSKRYRVHVLDGWSAGDRFDSVTWTEGSTKLYVDMRRGESDVRRAMIKDAPTGLHVVGRMTEGDFMIDVMSRGRSTKAEQGAVTARVKKLLVARGLPRGIVKP